MNFTLPPPPPPPVFPNYQPLGVHVPPGPIPPVFTQPPGKHLMSAQLKYLSWLAVAVIVLYMEMGAFQKVLFFGLPVCSCASERL